MEGARTQLKRDTGIICHFVIVSLPCDYHLSLNGAILFVARLRAMSFMDSIVFSLYLSAARTEWTIVSVLMVSSHSGIGGFPLSFGLCKYLRKG